jgi:hypothetical protein
LLEGARIPGKTRPLLQGDQDWWQLADAITKEDLESAVRHNAAAHDAHRLHVSASPIPCIGAVTTAPVVLLLPFPALESAWTPDDYRFTSAGWPLGTLHPNAQTALRDRWRSRLAALVNRFGPHHVANSIACVFLTPWCSGANVTGLVRLPSRRRMLDLAAAAAARDALLVAIGDEHVWTEHPHIAALPFTRRFVARPWRASELSPATLGDDAWTAICQRVAIHAWI